MDYSPKKMQEKLEQNSFKFKKVFGQNFIIDKNIIDNIIDKANIDKDTLVIEIGPGAGSLTNRLCEKSKNTLCYEIDETLKDILKDNLKEYDNVEIIYKDFLKANVSEDTIKSLEQGRTWCSDKTLTQISEALNIDVVKLFLPIDSSFKNNKENSASVGFTPLS